METQGQIEEHLVEVADEMAEKAHKGQWDRSGVPYIEHPRTVAGYLKEPKEKIIGLLHDTLEDTSLTEKDLRPVFGDEITDTVLRLTHRQGEDYETYIERISEDPLASKVKLADLRHNMQISRLPVVTQTDIERMEKYKKAYKVLTEKWNFSE
jgi:(p)ppGpp synthase/HD superfamily hydrolase